MVQRRRNGGKAFGKRASKGDFSLAQCKFWPSGRVEIGRLATLRPKWIWRAATFDFQCSDEERADVQVVRRSLSCWSGRALATNGFFPPQNEPDA